MAYDDIPFQEVKVAAAKDGETHLGEVGGKTITSAVTLTRPADTNAYAAKDAVSNSTSAPAVLTFASFARVAAGGGVITKARLLTNQSTNTARFVLHLYSAAPTAINDNAAFALLWASRASWIGSIVFPACATEGTGSDCAYAIATPGIGNLPLEFQCAAASQALYGALEVLDAFTPVSGQVFYVELQGEAN